jgi:hypothetical protein
VKIKYTIQKLITPERNGAISISVKRFVRGDQLKIRVMMEIVNKAILTTQPKGVSFLLFFSPILSPPYLWCSTVYALDGHNVNFLPETIC